VVAAGAIPQVVSPTARASDSSSGVAVLDARPPVTLTARAQVTDTLGVAAVAIPQVGSPTARASDSSSGVAVVDARPLVTLTPRTSVVSSKAPPLLTFTLLYLFSGMTGLQGSFAQACDEVAAKIGVIVHVEEFDTLNDPSSQNIVDDEIWIGIKKKISAKHYSGGLMSPPCDSFGCRRSDEFGAGPLRDCAGAGLYGRKCNTPDEKAKIRVANLLACRAAEAASLFSVIERPWICEQPSKKDGRPHMFDLQQWVAVTALAGVSDSVFPQCMVGSKYLKLTALKSYGVKLIPAHFPPECIHECCWFRSVPSGEWYWSAHPHLAGKIESVRAEDWRSEMQNLSQRSRLPWLTKATSRYPSKMNMGLARVLLMAIVGSSHSLSLSCQTR
jgi:hypothetical protein